MRGGYTPDRISFRFEGQLPSKSNKLWSRGKHRVTASRRWKRIKEVESEIGFLALQAWRKEGGSGQMLGKYEGRVPVVSVRCVNQRIDPNNAPKLICDALEGICYLNDRDVGAYAAPPKRVAGEKAYVDIEVEWRRE